VESLIVAARSCSQIELDIAIAINGSDDESFEVAQRLAQTHTKQVRIIRKFEPALSPAGARNQMLRELNSPWVLFIDDDAFIDPGFFQQFDQSQRRFENASAIGGPNLTPMGSTAFQKTVGLVMQSRLATYMSSSRYRKAGKARACDERDLILCNLFVRKDALGDSPFPDDFQCAEENWLIQTLTAQGRQVVHDPDLCVWHERRDELKKFSSQVFKYGFGRGQNIRRRPKTARIAHLIPSFCLVLAVLSLLRVAVVGRIHLGFGILFGVYILLCWVAASRQADRFAGRFQVAALFPVVHICYGAGVIAGLLGFAL
jgi:glycosyltransferase involved in cell wall biosynthesis